MGIWKENKQIFKLHLDVKIVVSTILKLTKYILQWSGFGVSLQFL